MAPAPEENRRFIWPPRPVNGGVDGTAAGAGRGAEPRPPSPERAELREPTARSHPGPRAACADSGALAARRALGPLPRSPHSAPGTEAPQASLLAAIESVWLDRSTPPLVHRIAAAAWVPDRPTAYCFRCGAGVGPHQAEVSGCPACRDRRLRWERIVRLGSYEGLLREVIHEVKFTRWRRLGHDLGRILGGRLAAAMDEAGVNVDEAVLVPVPTSFWRRMTRGIDHALVISRGIAAATGFPIVPALRRTHRPSQTSVASSERAANVAGSIRAPRRLDLAGRTVVVVDDVTTTRATLTAACRALAEAAAGGTGKPARIWAAVLAVTPLGGTARRIGR